MEDSVFPFSEDFQLAILKMMFLDEPFLMRASGHVKEEYFNNKHLAWVFRTINRYYAEYNASPTIAILQNEARKHDVDKQAAYFKILEDILQAKGVEPEYVRKELTGFIRRNIFVEAYKQSANLYNNKNTEGAFEFTRNKMDELQSVDFDNEKGLVDFANPYKYIDEAANAAKTSVPTGIGPIDKVLVGGGMTPGTLTTLMSATNAGKSMVLLNFGFHAMMAGKKVVSIHHEDEELPTYMRIISRMTGIPYNKMWAGRLAFSEQEHHMIVTASKFLKKNWEMKFMYGSETTVEDVGNWLRLKKKEFNFDLAIDDYGQFIRTKRPTEGERFTQAIVYRTLKQIALELNVAMLTCAQGNREAQKVNRKGTDYLRSTDLAECFEIARVSSIIITLNRSDDQQQKDKLVFYLEKQRSGKVGVAVECKTDFNKCLTHQHYPNDSYSMFEINAFNPLLKDDMPGKEENK